MASQARLARARCIISTSARPAGRPRPEGNCYQRGLKCKVVRHISEVMKDKEYSAENTSRKARDVWF